MLYHYGNCTESVVQAIYEYVYSLHYEVQDTESMETGVSSD